MKLLPLLSLCGTLLALGSSVLVRGATKPPSLCDKYSMALFNSTNATVQSTLLAALVNTAVIGNYSPLGGKVPVAGILADGTFNDTPVSLLKYFDGSLKSTNVKGVASSVNFLDGGGAAPLKENKPANDTTSAQYTLLTHLYEYFGTALGCSSQKPNGAFSTYQGSPSMSGVHRYMNLNPAEVGYFITQVGLSAASFGVASEDVTAVGSLLASLFGFRCSPAVAFPPGSKAASQSVCLASSCPLAKGSDCAPDVSARSYPNGTGGVAPEPAAAGVGGSMPANSSSPNSNSSSSAGSNSTGSNTPASAAAPAMLNLLAFAHLAQIESCAVLAALALGAFGVATLL